MFHMLYNVGSTLCSSPTTHEVPKGLTASREKSITVTFHALLLKQMWEWNAKSKMYIRFGSFELGGWEYDCGPLTEHRYVLCVLSHAIYLIVAQCMGGSKAPTILLFQTLS